MADVPVGTMCSGGLDSSIVTAFARDEHPQIHAFNASVTDQPEADEGPFAERVAEALGVQLHTVHMTAASWRADLVETVCHTEYPLTHESSVPMSQIAALARARGVKVLLSGEGADELFGGYEWMATREYGDFRRRGDPAGRAARSVYRWLQRRGLLAEQADPRGEPADEVASFERSVAQRAETAYAHHRGARRRLEASCLADLGTYLPHLLNRQDKNTMQRSIETRVPFLDPDMVSLALNLPLEVRVEPRRKAVLRELGARHLPAGIATREKIGFGFDAGRYLEPAARPVFLQDGRLRELWGLSREQWAGATAGLSGESALRFWTGEIWCRALLEGQPVAAIEAELWRDDPLAVGARQPASTSSRYRDS
jgi:asparagine synthase (glutamine-hydrolysing)